MPEVWEGGNEAGSQVHSIQESDSVSEGIGIVTGNSRICTT